MDTNTYNITRPYYYTTISFATVILNDSIIIKDFLMIGLHVRK